MASIAKIPGERFDDGRPRYRAAYRDRVGKQHAKQFLIRRDAQAWLDQTTHDRIEGIRTDRSKQTVAELYDELHAGRPYSPKTLEVHATAWKRVPAGVRRSRISSVDVDTIDHLLAAVPKPAARDQVRKLLSTMFVLAIAKRRLTVNPAKRPVRRRTRTELLEERQVGRSIRYLGDAELARLVAEIPAEYRCMIRIMSTVGLRPGEAYALTVGRFELGGTLRIDRSIGGPTKTGEVRDIKLPAIVAEWIADHVEAFVPTRWEDPDALLFGVIDPNNWRRRVFAPAAKRAQLPELRPNDLRHAAVARAIGLGADVYSVQRMLGHAKPSITLDTYGALWETGADRLAEHLDEAIRATPLLQ